MLVVSATFTGVETLEWPWFCHRREHFLLIIVSEVGQTYQQNGRKLRAEIFLSATIFCKHFDMVLKLMRYKNAHLVFNFPSSFHKVVNSSKHRLQSILCIKTCKVFVYILYYIILYYIYIYIYIIDTLWKTLFLLIETIHANIFN